MRAEWDFMRDCDDPRGALAADRTLDGRDLSAWVDDFLRHQGTRRRDVVRRSRLNPTYAYQIMAGTRHAARDKLIQLAFGMRLGVDDACELLERGGSAALSPRSRRDVVVAWCLERGQSLDECDDLLWGLGERTVCADLAAS